MAGLQLFENIVGNCLVCGNTVFDGKTVNNLKFNLACLYLVGKHVFENSCALLGDDGADAVAAADADNDLVELFIVDKIALSLDCIGTVTLLTNESFKFFNCVFNL